MSFNGGTIFKSCFIQSKYTFVCECLSVSLRIEDKKTNDKNTTAQKSLRNSPFLIWCLRRRAVGFHSLQWILFLFTFCFLSLFLFGRIISWIYSECLHFAYFSFVHLFICLTIYVCACTPAMCEGIYVCNVHVLIWPSGIVLIKFIVARKRDRPTDRQAGMLPIYMHTAHCTVQHGC